MPAVPPQFAVRGDMQEANCDFPGFLGPSLEFVVVCVS
jgi:hypothetical protein